jgi:dynein heavy chain 1
VLLKNVHMSPLWLSKLEKRLHRLKPHPSFRLFMTMELTPKVGGGAGEDKGERRRERRA